ncbi:DUF6427 family protein [Flavobacterium sp. GT3R68]|uniref:DUF6427 family protein n=1 Tax=Flavobacterium sp. GT3R68 TaxID=2594437 RepID=UPI000F871FB8|nr:DUF6427 family protein [Flavobacterium sp. GT3R68]RTY95926.1 hypothetical protein EKL32_04580 [Flavobacterium sp. GSN2]TRW93698.1 hypothetical protein FNW07_01970 [Flavobacterium sp. GT3R68]
MITSLFRKSTPLNYALVILLMLVFFFLYQFQDISWTKSAFSIIQKVGILALFFGSLFVMNFITKKNGLSKDSTYPVFFYFLFLLLFPSILNNPNLVISNFFILLALRRLISMQTMKTIKEKIFDASFWVFVAALFHFWSVLFILMVFISILFHGARDYRNWFLPFVALFTVATIFVLFSVMADKTLIDGFLGNMTTNIKINYFENNYQNLALSIYVAVMLFFLVSLLTTLSHKPLILHSSYKKMISFFFIAITVFLVSSNKSNDILVFTFAPLSVMATSQIETPQAKLRQELVMFVLVACCLFTFFSQL